jgi:hypothetical protein
MKNALLSRTIEISLLGRAWLGNPTSSERTRLKRESPSRRSAYCCSSNSSLEKDMSALLSGSSLVRLLFWLAS